MIVFSWGTRRLLSGRFRAPCHLRLRMPLGPAWHPKPGAPPSHHNTRACANVASRRTHARCMYGGPGTHAAQPIAASHHAPRAHTAQQARGAVLAAHSPHASKLVACMCVHGHNKAVRMLASQRTAFAVALCILRRGGIFLRVNSLRMGGR